MLNSYFMTLVVITLRDQHGKHIGEPDLPCVVVLYNPELDPSIDMSDFPDDLFNREDAEYFIYIIAEGLFENFNDINSGAQRRRYMKNPSIGASIEGKWDGTVGLFVQTNTGILGLSCAHVIGNRGPDHPVIQPCRTDFKKSLKRLETMIAILERNIQNTTHDITRYIRTRELNDARKELEAMQTLQGNDENQTTKNLHFGVTVGTSEWGIIEYGNRNCIADYEFFKVNEERHPSPSSIDFSYSEDGVLGSVVWALAEKTGPLEWDLMVRKDGKTTGLTFGFIGGVYADWKPGKIEHKEFGKGKCSEYWILGETPERKQEFAEAGDSGASVIDKDGVIRGMVFLRTKINKIQIIIDPQMKIPDIAKISGRRNEDGTIDVHDVVTTIFQRSCFVLVQDIEMILKRSGIGGTVIYNG